MFITVCLMRGDRLDDGGDQRFHRRPDQVQGHGKKRELSGVRRPSANPLPGAFRGWFPHFSAAVGVRSRSHKAVERCCSPLAMVGILAGSRLLFVLQLLNSFGHALLDAALAFQILLLITLVALCPLFLLLP
jgi:hypothetical protein